MQAEIPNRRSVMPVKSRGGKRLRRRPATSGSGERREDEHVRTTADASKDIKSASKPGLGTRPGDKGPPYGGPSAGELPACGPGGARCKGGVSSSQALAWNRRTCRPDTGGQPEWPNLACWPRRGRTPSGRNREGQSTAGYRGGTARSSGEGPVTGLERRGRAGQIDLMSTRKGRN